MTLSFYFVQLYRLYFNLKVVANPAPTSTTYLSVGFRMKDSQATFVDGSDAIIITQTKLQVEMGTEDNFEVTEGGKDYLDDVLIYPG